jgi:hypothetical protein
MKYFITIIFLAICSIQLTNANDSLSAAPLFSLGLNWSGSWEENKTLINRAEALVGLVPAALSLRGQALDKRLFDIKTSPPWADDSKTIYGLAGGLYHKTTGSRLLYGVLDEWGLSARIRNPWIRSAPFAENHKPIMADLKTVTSSTKEQEAYLYLSSPWLSLFKETSWRGFAGAQTTVNIVSPDFNGGIEALLNKKNRFLLEGFYTEKTLPAKKSTSWFANPPPLPERDFRLYSLGFLWNNLYWSLSSDLAYSQTFAWGAGMYGNMGIFINPPLNANKKKPGPWSLSLSADQADSHYIGRDGTSPGAGFRTAGKIEYKGKRSALFRANTSLRSPGFGENFNRSSSTLYYRFSAPVKKRGVEQNVFPLRVTRLSLGFDRNAVNPEKILDSLDSTVGLSINPLPLFKSPFGINLTSQIKGLCSAADTPLPYPFPQYPYIFDSTKASGELSWSPGIFQLRTKWGYAETAKKEGQWDSSFSAAIRFKHGRFSLKIASPHFPEKWNYTLSWRLEKK